MINVQGQKRVRTRIAARFLGVSTALTPTAVHGSKQGGVYSYMSRAYMLWGTGG